MLTKRTDCVNMIFIVYIIMNFWIFRPCDPWHRLLPSVPRDGTALLYGSRDDRFFRLPHTVNEPVNPERQHECAHQQDQVTRAEIERIQGHGRDNACQLFRGFNL
jgi:hypothetical protein